MHTYNEIVSLSHEAALTVVDELSQLDRYSADGCDIARGIHPQWGPCVIIFPPFGQAISVQMPKILPVEITAILNVNFDNNLMLG